MRKYYFIATIILILPYCAISQPMSGTYIVGGVNGVFPTPAIAIQHLQQSGMNGPVTFKIAPGIYWEQIYISHISGNSYENKITLQSESGRNDDVIITYDFQKDEYTYLLLIGEIMNIEIRDITFKPLGLYSTSIQASCTNHNVSVLKIDNCVFHTCDCQAAKPSIGIGFVYGLDSLIISNNFFFGCRPISIMRFHSFQKTLFLLVDNNSFIQNSNYVMWGAKEFVTCMFVNNLIYTDQDGQRLIERETNNLFIAKNNKIIVNGVWGTIFYVQDYSAIIENNIIFAKNSKGIVGRNATIRHNTIVVNKSAVLSVDGVNELKNNILISQQGSLFTNTDPISTINSDFNVLNQPASYPLCVNLQNTADTVSDFASWQQLGNDINSQWGLPLFSKQEDLHLQPGNTLAIGAGTPIASVTTDIDGDSRDPVNPDIGADEVVVKPILDSVYYACKWSPFTLDAGAGYTSYLWSTGATTQTITLQPSGGSETHSCTVTLGTQSGHRTTEVRWIICTDIYDLQQKQQLTVKVFPNPAKESITLETSDDNIFSEGELHIYNTQGTRCFSTYIQPGVSSVNVSLKSLPSGLYIGRVVTRSGNGRSFRFIKN